MNTNLNKLFLAVILAASSLILQGCRDTDLALGAGVIVGVIIADGHDDYDHHHHYGDDGHRHPGYVAPRRWSAQVDLNSEAIQIQKLALKYGISEIAADKILASLESAEEGQLSALSNIGLEKNDLAQLAAGEKLSIETLNQVAEKLEMNISSAELLLEKIQTEVRQAQTQKPVPSYIPGH